MMATRPKVFRLRSQNLFEKSKSLPALLPPASASVQQEIFRSGVVSMRDLRMLVLESCKFSPQW